MAAPQLKLEHADSRGEIYSITLPDGHEVMLIHSTPGTFRGGHAHSCGEVVLLLSGLLNYHKQSGISFLVPGDVARNAAGEVHMGRFPEDSWLVEFKLAKKGEWTQEDYEPFREKVRASFNDKPVHPGEDPHPSGGHPLWPAGD
jgi:quercetin dioxygenase-like cupin family protein